MKKLSLLFMLAAGLVFGITSCGDDDEPEPGSITISGIPATATVDADELLGPVDVSVTSTFELATLEIEKNDASYATETLSGTSASYSFEYTPEAGDAGSNVVFEFTVTDVNGNTETATHVLTVRESESIVIVNDNITENTTWTSDKVWVLGGRIAVEAGATLTIEPGTVIKGQAGSGANATALLVARDAMIMAEGEETAPIIFTSVADEITPEQVANGDFTSPNLDPDINGLWGGVLILGNAPISAQNENDEDVNELQIEGIPTSDSNGLYGGDDAADNSGVFQYVSIRHGGSNIGAGNEINGLSLGGVGTGTVIENIEIVANQDDGIEWFGGTVNVTNALVWNTGDDAIDADQAWQGTLDNFVVVAPGDHNFELDGPEGSSTTVPADDYTIQNGTVIANDFVAERTSSDLINVDDNTDVDLINILFVEINDDPFQQINRVTAPEVTFTDIRLVIPSGTVDDYVNGTVPAGVTVVASDQIPTDAGADASVFGWTWADQAGGLDGIK